ncbi:chromate transporter [Orrella marina]
MMDWALNWSDWFALLGLFASLSLLSIGAGALTTTPQMYLFLVVQKGWLSATAFSTSIAIAQASPGPNMLFVALFGWNVGTAQGQWTWGVIALLTALAGFLLPSSICTVYGTRWVRQNQSRPWVRAFKIAVAPVSSGLLASTGWMLMQADESGSGDWRLWLLTVVTAVLVWKTRLHLLLLLAAGALAGVLASLAGVRF